MRTRSGITVGVIAMSLSGCDELTGLSGFRSEYTVAFTTPVTIAGKTVGSLVGLQSRTSDRRRLVYKAATPLDTVIFMATSIAPAYRACGGGEYAVGLIRVTRRLSAGETEEVNASWDGGTALGTHGIRARDGSTVLGSAFAGVFSGTSRMLDNPNATPESAAIVVYGDGAAYVAGNDAGYGTMTAAGELDAYGRRCEYQAEWRYLSVPGEPFRLVGDSLVGTAVRYNNAVGYESSWRVRFSLARSS